MCKYVDLTIQIADKTNQSTNVPTHSYTDDSVNNYGREVISLGLLYIEFVDSVREGDGERLLRMLAIPPAYFQSIQKNQLLIGSTESFNTI